MKVDRVALAVAVAAAVIGLSLAVVPGASASLALPDLVPTMVAAVAVLAGLSRLRKWLDHDVRQASPPNTERGDPVTVPGDDFDETLARVSNLGSAAGDTRAIMARDELRELAVDALVRYHGLSESEAEASVDAGTWTEDPLAAEFFTSLDGAGSSVTESVAGTFWGDGPFHRRARRAAREIVAITEAGGVDR